MENKWLMIKVTFQIVKEKTDYSYKRCWGNWLSIKENNNKIRPLPYSIEKNIFWNKKTKVQM